MSDTLRLFFALPCPPTVGAHIAAWRAGLGVAGRPVALSNLHVTLAFLGTQPASVLPDLIKTGASLRSSPFELSLQRLHRTRQGVLWLEPEPAPSPLRQLGLDLRQALQAAGITFDRQDFRPHLTLLRDSDQLPPAVVPGFAWTVDRFDLYLSEGTPQGVRYRSLAHWSC